MGHLFRSYEAIFKGFMSFRLENKKVLLQLGFYIIVLDRDEDRKLFILMNFFSSRQVTYATSMGHIVIFITVTTSSSKNALAK